MKSYAVVIGVDKYPNMPPDLPSPREDATKVADWFEQPERASKVERVIGIEGELSPLQYHIDAAFDRIRGATNGVTEAKRLYVYFAGHGVSADVDELALCTAAFAYKGYAGNALNSGAYQRELHRQAVFDEQIFFYDCCRTEDPTIRGVGPTWSDGERPSDGATKVARYVLMAAGFKQYANARKLTYSTERGLFTVALLEALNGEAGSGDLTMGTLASYVKDRVDFLTKKENLDRQSVTPDPYNFSEDLVVCTVPVRDVTVRVSADPPADSVIAFDESMQPIESKPLQAGQAEFLLKPGSCYTFRASPVDPGWNSASISKFVCAGLDLHIPGGKNG